MTGTGLLDMYLFLGLMERRIGPWRASDNPRNILGKIHAATGNTPPGLDVEVVAAYLAEKGRAEKSEI